MENGLQQNILHEIEILIDIGIISTEGGKEIFNITDSGYFDTNPRWVLDGNAIIWNSERYGMRNITLLGAQCLM